ncbi:hypothetical protein B0A48_02527 [Cryoendolithus antarcticus]|uniref:L-ornithine N(5)-monooxygenase [NAD(P)H] n=1 Tax=Cryoendolithus antarcticus TaxID=1507870 RepID=A0A1V8TNU9_9PEZI|nr:hypothetical protein B0A48_02527 [Cryoendolithus antarcticus]
MILIHEQGIYGLCAASTYLSLYPEANIRILEAGSDVGGVWSTERSYPGFWSQSGTRVAGFHDLPMTSPPPERSYKSSQDSKLVSKYLEDYASVRGVRERCDFKCSVGSIAKNGSLWQVTCKTDRQGTLYYGRKLIMATGLFTQPRIPPFQDRKVFEGPIVHQKDWGSSGIFTSEEPSKASHTHVTVLGGSKSAADIVYTAAIDKHHRRTVNWLIRDTGPGALSLLPAQGLGKYEHITELGTTRIISALSFANPWLPENWWSWFLHKTWIGERLMDFIWNKQLDDATASAKYDTRRGALPGFRDLKSYASARWRTGYFGALNRDPEDFWNVIAQKVNVFRGEIGELGKDTVVLKDGREIQTDVLLLATGFEQAHPEFSANEAAELGLPVSNEHAELFERERAHWSALDHAAEQKVLQRWPYLHDSPLPTKEQSHTPYRLYNHTTPAADPSIAFLGIPLCANSYHVAFVQSLYAIAVMDGHIRLPAREAMEQDIAYVATWNRRKYPAIGGPGNAMEFEMVAYTDKVLGELGLESHKKKSWWMWMTEPVWAEENQALLEEFRAKYGKI